MKTKDSLEVQKSVKKIFWNLGTCSRTFFYLLNRDFGNPLINEERAADPLAGGVMRQGYQCGMLWGSTLAVGAESFRRYKNRDQAVAVAIKTTQNVMKSFVSRTGSPDCLEITKCDFNSKISMAKYMLTGRFLSCFKLAEKWAPEAVQAANDGISGEKKELSESPISCASEVVKKMGGGDKEAVMVAGFAGGLGLSGNACGALSAAIWFNSLKWGKDHSEKKAGYPNPKAEKTLEAFQEETEHEFLCRKITGRKFETINDHAEFIKCGGCEKLINALAQA